LNLLSSSIIEHLDYLCFRPCLFTYEIVFSYFFLNSEKVEKVANWLLYKGHAYSLRLIQRHLNHVVYRTSCWDCAMNQYYIQIVEKVTEKVVRHDLPLFWTFLPAVYNTSRLFVFWVVFIQYWKWFFHNREKVEKVANMALIQRARLLIETYSTTPRQCL